MLPRCPKKSQEAWLMMKNSGRWEANVSGWWQIPHPWCKWYFSVTRCTTTPWWSPRRAKQEEWMDSFILLNRQLQDTRQGLGTWPKGPPRSLLLPPPGFSPSIKQVFILLTRWGGGSSKSGPENQTERLGIISEKGELHFLKAALSSPNEIASNLATFLRCTNVFLCLGFFFFPFLFKWSNFGALKFSD